MFSNDGDIVGVKRTFTQTQIDWFATPKTSTTRDSGDHEDNVWARLSSLTKHTAAKIEIKGTEFGIGRDPDNDLHINDARLSRFHCRITRSWNAESGAMEVYLHDLSKNGTFKNGEIVSCSLMVIF